MCPHNTDSHIELSKLPALIKEKGWSCSEIRGYYAHTEPGCWLQGDSGYERNGTAFQVIAREDDLKVRVGWPGQFTTTYTCFSAMQVMWWLERILACRTYNGEQRNECKRCDQEPANQVS
jgi:hypothetical protein